MERFQQRQLVVVQEGIRLPNEIPGAFNAILRSLVTIGIEDHFVEGDRNGKLDALELQGPFPRLVRISHTARDF